MPHSLSICPGNLSDMLVPPRQDPAFLSPENSLCHHSFHPSSSASHPGVSLRLSQCLGCTPRLTDVPILTVGGGGQCLWISDNQASWAQLPTCDCQSWCSNANDFHGPQVNVIVPLATGPCLPIWLFLCPAVWAIHSSLSPLPFPYTYSVPCWQTLFPAPPYYIQFPIVSTYAHSLEPYQGKL